MYLEAMIIRIICTTEEVEQWNQTENPEIDLKHMWESTVIALPVREGEEGVFGENITQIPASAKTFRQMRIEKYPIYC